VSVFWATRYIGNIKYSLIFKLLFHCKYQKNIGNNTVTEYPTAPQVCRYTTLRNVSVLKATVENKTNSVTTYFKKLITGNNVFLLII